MPLCPARPCKCNEVSREAWVRLAQLTQQTSNTVSWFQQRRWRGKWGLHNLLSYESFRFMWWEDGGWGLMCLSIPLRVRHSCAPNVYILELITFEILAAERLRLMGFDNQLIIDCFANVVNILIWLFSTNDRLRSAKYESNYLANRFPEIKGVN